MRWRSSAAAVALLLAGCGGGERRFGPAGARQDETGIASWYGAEFAGRPTASGEPFDPDALTAAHRTLPLGSLAAVTALDTGRIIVVRVTDRGPGRSDRLIDLSAGAARLLGIDRQPLARVRVQPVVGTTPGLLSGGMTPRAAAPLTEGRYLIQVASFADRDRATALAARLGGFVLPDGPPWRVRLGPFPSAAATQEARDAVAGQGYGDARALPIP